MGSASYNFQAYGCGSGSYPVGYPGNLAVLLYNGNWLGGGGCEQAQVSGASGGYTVGYYPSVGGVGSGANPGFSQAAGEMMTVLQTGLPGAVAYTFNVSFQSGSSGGSWCLFDPTNGTRQDLSQAKRCATFSSTLSVLGTGVTDGYALVIFNTNRVSRTFTITRTP